MVIKSTFMKEALIYGLVGVLSKFAPLIVIPIYLQYLGIEAFGVLDLYITIGTLVYIIIEMQITSGFMRSYYEEKKEGTLGELVGNCLVLYLFSFSIFIWGLVVCSALFDFNVSFLTPKLLLPVAIGLIGRCFIDLLQLSFRMEHRPTSYSVLALSNVVITALTGAVIAATFSDRVDFLLLSISLVQLCFGSIAYYVLRQNYEVKVTTEYSSALLAYGLPIAIASLGGWLLAAAGRLVLADKASALELGIYSVSLKVALIYMVLLQAFRTAWDPLCMKMFGEKNSKASFALYLRIYLIVGALVVFFVSSLAQLVYEFLGADRSSFSYSLILMLLLGYYWQGVINIIAVGNAWARKTHWNALGTLAGGAFGLVSTSTLYGDLGVVAGGVGFLFGMICGCLIILCMAQSNIKIPYKYRDLFVAVFLTGVFVWSNI